MLPKKTFLSKEITLSESDFDACGYVKACSVMQKMQDEATEHADHLGFGWNEMDKHGLFWALSKVKLIFFRPVTRENRSFTLYTWPIAANKYFVERRFEAACGGETVFSACTVWLILDKNERKIATPSVVEKVYAADFDCAPCECDAKFERVRKDENFSLAYVKTVLRGDIDINRHVNNTLYATYVTDVLGVDEKIKSLEITYNKELAFESRFSVFSKREGNSVYVVGEKDGETSFSSKLTLE